MIYFRISGEVVDSKTVVGYNDEKENCFFDTTLYDPLALCRIVFVQQSVAIVLVQVYINTAPN